jgi:hypothetical protein
MAAALSTCVSKTISMEGMSRKEAIFRTVIFRNRVAKMKLVKQLILFTLQTAHHGSTSPRFASAQRNHGSRPFSTDFCNKIGTKRIP